MKKERLFERDPYRREFDATVMEARPEADKYGVDSRQDSLLYDPKRLFAR